MKKTRRWNNKASIQAGAIILSTLFVISGISIVTYSNVEPAVQVKNIRNSDNMNLMNDLEYSPICDECYVNTIEGTVKLSDGSDIPGITVSIQSSSGTKTTTTGSTGYWQVDVGTLTGGNWTWGISFTVTYSGTVSGISWTGSTSGTVCQPPICLYDCGTTYLTPLNTNNTPPNTPTTPSGNAKGKIGVSYEYTSSATDSDGDQIYYFFDWGDGTNSGWVGAYNSGEICQESHIWNAKGSYSIKVKAKDQHEAESDWSNPLPITMPYAHTEPILHILELLFQRFPNAFLILRHLAGD